MTKPNTYDHLQAEHIKAIATLQVEMENMKIENKALKEKMEKLTQATRLNSEGSLLIIRDVKNLSTSTKLINKAVEMLIKSKIGSH